MPVPVLNLDLAPPQTLWRQHHRMVGWSLLAAGGLALAATSAISVLAYREARMAGRDAALKTSEARALISKQQAILEQLRGIDVEKELPAWRLAERILGERSLPWSRLTVELERSLVQDVRLKSIQRTRNAAQVVELKLRGEAKSRAAEEAFVASLQANPVFTQVVLEREADRQGGGVEFDYTLSVTPTPPPCQPLPLYGPPRPPQGVPAPPAPTPAQPVPAKAPPVPPQAPEPPAGPRLVPARPPVLRNGPVGTGPESSHAATPGRKEGP